MISVALSAVAKAMRSRIAARWIASKAMWRCGDHSGNRLKILTRCAAEKSGPTILTKRPSLKYDGGSAAHSPASRARCRLPGG